MSFIKIYNDNDSGNILLESIDPNIISAELAKIGVVFERWNADEDLDNKTDDEILKSYNSQIDKLKNIGGYVTADIVRVSSDNPNKKTIREKFLNEHIHAEDEVRFFVEGSGIFYLHQDNKVFQILCEKNDLISVPAGVRHWFDMSENPYLTCIRLFTNPDGWVADFTGDDIAGRFPLYE